MMLRDRVILVADDTETMRHQLLTRLRAAFPGFEIRVFPTASQLLDNMVDTELVPDCVISDQVMPDIGGAEMLRRIRDESPGALRILHSGSADKSFVSKMTAEGVIEAYIEKGESTDALIDTVKRELSERIAYKVKISEVLVYQDPQKNDPHLRYGDRCYSPIELLAEAQNLSPVGIQFVEDMLDYHETMLQYFKAQGS